MKRSIVGFGLVISFVGLSSCSGTPSADSSPSVGGSSSSGGTSITGGSSSTGGAGRCQQDVTLIASPPEAGTLKLSTNTYQQGDTVIASATPANSWAFNHWEGDAVGSATASSLAAHAHPTSSVADVSMDIDRQKTQTLDGSTSRGLPVETDLTVNCGGTVTAVFSSLAYQWSQSAGTAVILNDAASSKPTFSVENTGTGVYEFQLLVSNGVVTSAADRTSIRVFDVDLTYDPTPGTTLTIGTEQCLSVSTSFSGLPVGAELHLGLDVSSRSDSFATSLILAANPDFKIPRAKTTGDTIIRFLAGSDAAFVADLQESQGTKTGTICLTPPNLSVAYNQVIITPYVFDPANSNVLPVWSLGDQPPPAYPVTP